jgi:hypothetical protein
MTLSTNLKKIFFKVLKSPRWTVLVVLVFSFVILVVYGWSIGRDEFYRRHHQAVQWIKKSSDLLYFPYLFTHSQLERYDLVIADSDLNFLNNNLPAAYQGNLLTSQYRQKVKAKFTAASKDYAVKVRYRGDTDGHWRDDQKSWLIDFGKNYFERQKEMHLIIPVDRYYLLEELNFYRARKMGLVAPLTKFVNFFVNGKRQGVYWQVEGFSRDMLEKQKISSLANFYNGENFSDLSQSLTAGHSYFDDIFYWTKYADNTLDNHDNYTDLDLLLGIINHPSNEYFNQHIGDIVDLDNFYHWQVNQVLVASQHDVDSNLRFYFDPVIGKFKFTVWDVSLGDSGELDGLLKSSNMLTTRILANPEFLKARNQVLLAYVSDLKNLEDDLRHYDELDRLTKNDFYQDYLKVESNLTYREKVKAVRQALIDHFEYVKKYAESQNH